jgi:glycosyltransferase involved in cell wall biosynthesis
LSKRFFDPTGWRKFSKIIENFKPDIIQANASDTLKFTTSSKLMYSWRQPIIYRIASKMGDYISSSSRYYLNRFYLSRVDYFIAVSEECRTDFIDTFYFPKEKVETVEVGVEEKVIGGIPEDLQEIMRSSPVISHVGGFVHEKNHEGLIRIFNEVLKKNHDVQLLMIGKGIFQEKIREMVLSYNLSENVHFLGYRNDVLEVIHHSDVFVLPSVIEGLPAVLLEAMYSETPVVAYNVGGVSEILSDGRTGWLIEKGDEKGFADAIEVVLKDKLEPAKRTSEAKKIVEEKFKNSKISLRFAEAYQKVLRKNKND